MLVPVPGTGDPAGVVVKVQIPVAGKPVNVMLPVDIEQSGWEMLPIIGAVDDGGALLISMGLDNAEVHPNELVTV